MFRKPVITNLPEKVDIKTKIRICESCGREFVQFDREKHCYGCTPSQ